jgi:glutathione S-transferase
MLGADSDNKTIARYQIKFRQEAEPQMLARLATAEYICGERFSAVDCVMGQNVLWARAYGLCQQGAFADYIGRLSQRTAFAKAYADLENFTLAPPDSAAQAMAELFTG